MDIPSVQTSSRVSGTDFKLNLTCLSFDVQVHIMEFLNPRDILRLRMVRLLDKMRCNLCSTSVHC